MPKKATIYFQEAKDCKTVAATGAWGGVGPAGDIIAHFFVDEPALPESITVEEKEGSIKEVERTQVRVLLREVVVKVVMRPDIARSIGKWLIEKADGADTLKAKEFRSEGTH